MSISDKNINNTDVNNGNISFPPSVLPKSFLTTDGDKAYINFVSAEHKDKFFKELFKKDPQLYHVLLSRAKDDNLSCNITGLDKETYYGQERESFWKKVIAKIWSDTKPFKPVMLSHTTDIEKKPVKDWHPQDQIAYLQQQKEELTESEYQELKSKILSGIQTRQPGFWLKTSATKARMELAKATLYSTDNTENSTRSFITQNLEKIKSDKYFLFKTPDGRLALEPKNLFKKAENTAGWENYYASRQFNKESVMFAEQIAHYIEKGVTWALPPKWALALYDSYAKKNNKPTAGEILGSVYGKIDNQYAVAGIKSTVSSVEFVKALINPATWASFALSLSMPDEIARSIKAEGDEALRLYNTGRKKEAVEKGAEVFTNVAFMAYLLGRGAVSKSIGGKKIVEVKGETVETQPQLEGATANQTISPKPAPNVAPVELSVNTAMPEAIEDALLKTPDANKIGRDGGTTQDIRDLPDIGKVPPEIRALLSARREKNTPHIPSSVERLIQAFVFGNDGTESISETLVRQFPKLGEFPKDTWGSLSPETLNYIFGKPPTPLEIKIKKLGIKGVSQEEAISRISAELESSKLPEGLKTEIRKIWFTDEGFEDDLASIYKELIEGKNLEETNIIRTITHEAPNCLDTLIEKFRPNEPFIADALEELKAVHIKGRKDGKFLSPFQIESIKKFLKEGKENEIVEALVEKGEVNIDRPLYEEWRQRTIIKPLQEEILEIFSKVAPEKTNLLRIKLPKRWNESPHLRMLLSSLKNGENSVILGILQEEMNKQGILDKSEINPDVKAKILKSKFLHTVFGEEEGLRF